MGKILMILEVGQKQSFIFAHKEVKRNILHSNLIRWVTDVRYFEEVMKESGKTFDAAASLVYTGGGHTVLEFPEEETARDFARTITRYTLEKLNGLELYVTMHIYQEDQTPGANLRCLMEKLEQKKELKKSSFKQSSFGIEKVDVNTKKPVLYREKIYDERTSAGFAAMTKELKHSMAPNAFTLVDEFEKLGNEKGESSYIAVVHIDGNHMGKRVEDIRSVLDEKCLIWEEYKKKIKAFSDSIDEDFQGSYKDMVEKTEEIIKNNPHIDKSLNMETGNFPIRRIITAGDDICFVAEGRIGIESAAMFLKSLEQKKNAVDGKSYSACAGVALVHTKYPFFKAYELAEKLCENAKSFASSRGSTYSAIDWHLEQGEAKDSLKDIREDYVNMEGAHLELRPYLMTDSKEVLQAEPYRNYKNFRKLVRLFQNDKIAYANGKLKGFRDILKKTEVQAEYYLISQLIDDLTLVGYQDIFVPMNFGDSFQGKELERKLFYKEDKECIQRCLLFDALEVFDSCILLMED